MTRPNHATIVEAWEDTRSHLHVWIVLGSVEVCVFIPQAAVENRKLHYGWAHQERDVFFTPTPNGEHREFGDVRTLDHDPQADDKALAAILAEHLDRWEEHAQPVGGLGADGAPSVAPSRPSKDARQGWKRREDLEKHHVVPASAPDVSPVETVFVRHPR